MNKIGIEASALYQFDDAAKAVLESQGKSVPEDGDVGESGTQCPWCMHDHFDEGEQQFFCEYCGKPFLIRADDDGHGGFYTRAAMTRQDRDYVRWFADREIAP